jgi:hypothetical protein
MTDYIYCGTKGRGIKFWNGTDYNSSLQLGGTTNTIGTTLSNFIISNSTGGGTLDVSGKLLFMTSLTVTGEIYTNNSNQMFLDSPAKMTFVSGGVGSGNQFVFDGGTTSYISASQNLQISAGAGLYNLTISSYGVNITGNSVAISGGTSLTLNALSGSSGVVVNSLANTSSKFRVLGSDSTYFLVCDVVSNTVYVDGGLKKRIKNIDDTDSPYTFTSKDYSIVVDNSADAVTVNLPASPSEGQEFRIKCTSSAFPCTLGRNTKNIDGDASDVSLIEDETVTVQYDGTEWWIDGTEWWIF